MLGVLQGFAVILGLIGAGYATALAGVVKGDQRRVLNSVAFYVATPALLFTVLYQSDPAVVFSPVILVTTVTAVLSAGVFIIASRIWFRRDLSTSALGATTAGYVNSNNLGLPIAIYVLGDAAYVAPLILIQVLFFSPPLLAILEHGRGNSAGLTMAVARAFKNPILIASALGISCALLQVELPSVLLAPIDMLGAASIPMILLSFGISLRGQRALQRGSGRLAVFTSTGIKVMFMPLATWVICVALGLSAQDTFAATIIAALPCAQNLYNYAATYRKGEILVRDTIFLSTFVSLPVIALIALLLAP